MKVFSCSSIDALSKIFCRLMMFSLPASFNVPTPSNLFNSVADFIRENEDLWEGLGRTIGSVFTFLAKLVQEIKPLFKAFGAILSSVTEVLGDFSAILLLLASPTAWVTLIGFVTKFNVSLVTLSATITGLLARIGMMALPVIAAFTALLEIINLVKGTGKGFLSGAEQSGFFQEHISSGVNPAAFATMGSMNAFGALPPITLNNTIEIDGEKVAESVAKTTTMDNTIDNRMLHNMQN